MSGCRCSSWTSQPLEKPLTEKAPPLQAIVQIMRPFFCPLSFTPNVYNWSHQIFLHLPQMLLGVNALSIERFSVLRIRAKNLRIRKCSQRAKSHAEDYWGEVELAVRVVWLQHWGFVVGKKKGEAKHQWQSSQASAKTKIVELQVHWSSINVPGKQTIFIAE